MFPLIQKWLDPVLTLDLTGNTSRVPGATGGDVVFTLTVKAYSFGPLLEPSGLRPPPGRNDLHHREHDSHLSRGRPLPTADPAQVGNKITWSLSPDTMNANDTLTIQFTGHLPSGASAIFRNEATPAGP